VEPVRQPRGYCRVYVDGQPALTAPRRVVASVGLHPGRTLDTEALDEAIVAAKEQEALDWALRRLTGRDRTEEELRRGLAQRKFPQPIIATALDRLREKGLIDDRRYARDYVRTQGERRGVGPAALRAKLVQLGVASSVVDEALAVEMPDERQRDIAETVARKRLPRLRTGEGDSRRSRLYAAIVRRGFDDDVAAYVVDKLLEDE
jgi:regulatory protein